MNRRQEVCRDFQRGSCRFGLRCKFLHEAPQQQRNSFGFGSKNQPDRAGPYREGNYYSPLSGTAFTQRQQQPQSQLQVKEHKCIDPRVCKEQIKEDFQNEQPTFWRLTCYAHWKFFPNDITGDVSFEELRSLAYHDAKQGKSLKDVVQRETAMFSAKNAEFENLLKNPYRGPAATTTLFHGAGVSSTSDGTQLLFGRPIPATTLAPSSSFGQVTFSNRGAFSFGKEASVFPLNSGNQFPAPTPSSFAFQHLPQNPLGITPTASASGFVQQDKFHGNRRHDGEGTGAIKFGTGALGTFSGASFGGTNTPIQSQLVSSSSIFQTENMVPPPLMNNNNHLLTGLPYAETMSIEPPIDTSSSLQQVSPASTMKASEKKSSEDDIWLKESWALGEIPEQEPPAYAR